MQKNKIDEFILLLHGLPSKLTRHPRGDDSVRNRMLNIQYSHNVVPCEGWKFSKNVQNKESSQLKALDIDTFQ